MPNWEDVRQIALTFPDVEEVGTGFRVKGKLFAWQYPERVDPKKGRVPNPAVLSVFVPNLWEKDTMITTEPDKFFTTDHYDGYSSILVRLSETEREELADLIKTAWLVRAPRKLAQEYEERRLLARESGESFAS